MFENVNTLWATVFVDELARCGLRAALVAPGSRSTALALALAAHPDIEDVSIIDERTAAFVALGWAQASAQPVLVLATSGTATANFFPAICEADRAAVPLLVVTADRPPQLRDCGDSQAMDQLHLYGARVRWFHEMAIAQAQPASLRYLRSTLDEAFARAVGIGSRPGPVHLNVPFSKPLEPTATVAGPGALDSGFDPEDPAVLGRDGRDGGRPWTRVDPSISTTAAASQEALDGLTARLMSAKRPLLVAGALLGGIRGSRDGSHHRLRRALRRWVEATGAPAWVEAASNLRFDPHRHPLVIGCADLLLAHRAFRTALDASPPDLVIHLGEAPIGWPLRRLFSKLGNEPGSTFRVTINADGRRTDPDHRTDQRLVADPILVLEELAQRITDRRPTSRPALETWANLHTKAASAIEASFEARQKDTQHLFEGRVFSSLAEILPEDAALVVSSSMPIRDVETFAPRSRQDLEMFANRGLNGIDGVISTALGIALGRRIASGSPDLTQEPRDSDSRSVEPRSDSRTVVVLGDVAFTHDLGGFAAAARLAHSEQARNLDLTVVVVDNGGGAIFDHLPAAAFEPAFGRLFTTPPQLSAAAIAEALQVPAFAPTTVENMAQDLRHCLEQRGLQLVAVQVERESSKERRQAMVEAIVADPSVQADFAVAPSDASEAQDAPDNETAGGSVHALTSQAVDPESRAWAITRPTNWVLLHGFAGAPGDWDELRHELGGGTLFVPTLPGHGTRPAPASFAVAVEELWDEIDNAGLGSFRLAGYSLGGRLALGMAVSPRAQGRLEGLALIAASAGLDEAEARLKRRQEDEEQARLLEQRGLTAFLDRWSTVDLFAGEARRGHRRQRLRRQRRLSNRSAGLAAVLRQLGPGVQPVFANELANLPCPWLYVAGEADTKYHELGKALVASSPSGHLEVLSGVGHSLLIEAPREVGSCLRRWAEQGSQSR